MSVRILSVNIRAIVVASFFISPLSSMESYDDMECDEDIKWYDYKLEQQLHKKRLRETLLYTDDSKKDCARPQEIFPVQAQAELEKFSSQMSWITLEERNKIFALLEIMEIVYIRKNRPCTHQSCSLEFRLEKKRRDHCIKRHCGSGFNYECPACDLKIVVYEEFVGHTKCHIKELFEIYKVICSICNKLFTNYTSYENHCDDDRRKLLTQAQSDYEKIAIKKKHPCTFLGCIEEFDEPAARTKHIRENHAEDDLHYYCNLCEYRTKRLNNFAKQHLQVHIKELFQLGSVHCSMLECNDAFDVYQPYVVHSMCHK